MRQANKQPGRYLPSPCALPYLATPWPATSRLPFPPRPASRALRGESPRPAARPATGWLRPRSAGDPPSNSASGELAPRRPGAQPCLRVPWPPPGPTTTPFSVRRGPSGPPALANWAPLRQPTSRAARSPSGKVAEKSLVYWAVAIPGWIHFPISTVPFCRSLTPKGKGWPPADRWIGSRVGYGEGRRSNFRKSPRAEGGAGLRGQAGVSRNAEAAGAG